MADQRAIDLPPYLRKALREAKRNTNWVEPNEDWEDAVIRFATGLLTSDEFLAELRAPRCRDRGSRRTLRARAARPAPHLAGVPDIYDGEELPLLTLVDPDNRRPVDWERRRRLLDELGATPAAGSGSCGSSANCSHFARRSRLAFAGTYEPVAAGPGTCAFRRGSNVLVAVSLRGERQRIGPPNENWHDVLGGLPNSPAAVFERL